MRTRLISTFLAATVFLSACPSWAFAAQTHAQLRVEASSQGTVTVASAGSDQGQGKRLTLSATTGQHIARDYDQTLYVQVTNHSSVQALYYLECSNPYDDLSLNFVMNGSINAPLAINPGETQSVELSVFAQNAEQTSYTLPITSKIFSETSFVSDGSMNLTFSCDPGNGTVSITPSGDPDPNTMSQTYTVTNVGNNDIADLGLTIAGDDAAYLRLDPIVSNHPLAVGESVTVDLVPDLAKMQRDNQSVLTGSIVPTGGVSNVTSDAAPETRTLSAQSAIARSASAGVSFSVNVNPNEIHTISAADLALYQNGNPFYDSEFVQEDLHITSTVNGQQTDLGELSTAYWDPDNPNTPQTDGVNTSDEFNEVLGKIIDPTTKTYNLTVRSKLRYTNESGSKSEVGITVNSFTELVKDPPSTEQIQADYYYDLEKDELTIITTAYNPDVQGYLDQMDAGIAEAQEELGITPAISGNVARSARSDTWDAVMEQSTTTFSNAGLDLLDKLADESKHLDFSNLNTPEEIAEYRDTMKQVNNLAEATTPVRSMAKVLDTAGALSEGYSDMKRTADVWKDPVIPLRDKMIYSAVMTVKNVFDYSITPFMTATGGTLGGALFDGVGIVVGATCGATAGNYVVVLAEKDLQLYEALFAQMRFRVLGYQCTNRDKILVTFSMPETKLQQSTSAGEEGITACLDDGVYTTSRTYEGQPISESYADETLGGDEFRHYRDMITDYWLNDQWINAQTEHGLSEVSFAKLSGPEVTEALQTGENTLMRKYNTDPGHYMVETESTVTVAPGSDFEMGYTGSPSGLPDVRQMPDLAVYSENIRPEKTVIVGEENTVTITVNNIGSAGGWANVTAQYKGRTMLDEKNVYVAPFSSKKLQFTWTPEDEQNTISVSLAQPTTGTDGVALDTGEIDSSNNKASAEFEARHRIVPQLIKWPDRIIHMDVPYFITEIADASDVKSVQVKINSTTYSGNLTNIYSDGKKVLRATAPLRGLTEGEYDAEILVQYYTTNENGKTAVATLSKTVPIQIRQYGQIPFQISTSQSNVSTAMVLCPNSDGKLATAPTTSVIRTMGTTNCIVKYDPDVLTNLQDCILVLRYSGNPGGLVVTPLNELAGKKLSVTDSGYVKATITTTSNESFAYNYLTQLDGVPLADPEAIQLPADSNGNIYFCGAESIEINTRVSLNKPKISSYIKIPISRDNANHTLSDYYSAYEIKVNDILTSHRLERIDTLLTDADGSTHTNSSARWDFDFSNDGSDDWLMLFLPFSTAEYTAAHAALFYNDGNDLTAYYDVDLLQPAPIDSENCSKVSFRLPDGSTPYSITVTVVKQGIGQEMDANCYDMYLGTGTYDLKIVYQPEEGDSSLMYDQQVTVTDAAPQTVTLPVPAAPAEATALLARTDTSSAVIRWPVLFLSAKLRTQANGSWSGETAVDNGGTVALPPQATQVQLNLSGTGRTATVLAPAADEITVGDTFTGIAAATRDSYTAGDQMTLQLSGLTDADGATLTAYRASDSTAALAGSIVLTGENGNYNIPVSTTDLQAGVKAALPSDLPAGEYRYTVSLLTEQMVEEPVQPGDDNPEGNEGGGSGDGGGTGGGAGGGSYVPASYPAVTVNGTGGTATAENGTVTITPDEGYRIAMITVNGEEVTIPADGKLTGCRQDDKVIVIFEKIPVSALPFVDVADAAWYADAVRYVYEKGMMNGTSSTTFSPDETTTRGMIVTMLHRLEGAPAAEHTGFTDVAADAYYADAVAWAAATGIVNGISETAFAPDSAITREQMAAILYRYATQKGLDVSASQPLDAYHDAAQVSAYALDAMQWANAAGLITGNTATTLNPAGQATRAEVATILMRFCEILP